jgi:hypothetical protein
MSYKTIATEKETATVTPIYSDVEDLVAGQAYELVKVTETIEHECYMPWNVWEKKTFKSVSYEVNGQRYGNEFFQA